MRVFVNGLDRIDWTAAVIRAALGRSTGTYDFDPAHQTLAAIISAGWVEISVSSYERKTLASKTVTPDFVNGVVIYDANDVEFGELESGQQVSNLLIYAQVGGDDSTPATDIPLLFDDGTNSVVLAAPALEYDELIYIEPSYDNFPIGSAIDFGGGATADLAADLEIGDRQIAITALGANAAAGSVAENVVTTRIVPGFDVLAILQGGEFTVRPSEFGFWFSRPRP